MNDNGQIRIVLADDHDLYRRAFRELLAREVDILVVGEANEGTEAVKLVEILQPDVVVIDVVMPRQNGIQATRQILRSSSSVRVVALSLHDDAGFVKGMLESGANGYMLKDDDQDDLIEGIRAVAAGEVYLSPKLRGLGR